MVRQRRDPLARRQVKISFSLDDRTMKVLKAKAKELNISTSSLIRILATKLESGEFKL